MIRLNRKGLNLTCDTNFIPAQGSENIPVNLENDNSYDTYAVVPYVGWITNGLMVSTTRELKNNSFSLPANAFKQSGKVYVSLALIKDDVKIKLEPVVFTVLTAPESDVKLQDDSSWEIEVSNIVKSLFDARFENEINVILDDVKKLNKETDDLQERINIAISQMGVYEWNGTSIRFKKGDGTWGEYYDLSGDFATKKYVDEYIFNENNLKRSLDLANHDINLPATIKINGTTVDLSKLVFYEE